MMFYTMDPVWCQYIRAIQQKDEILVRQSLSQKRFRPWKFIGGKIPVLGKKDCNGQRLKTSGTLVYLHGFCLFVLLMPSFPHTVVLTWKWKGFVFAPCCFQSLHSRLCPNVLGTEQVVFLIQSSHFQHNCCMI